MKSPKLKIAINSLVFGAIVSVIALVITAVWSENNGYLLQFVGVASLLAGVLYALIVQSLFRYNRVFAIWASSVLTAALIGLGLWGL